VTGYRRAICDCCWETGCGICANCGGGVSLFCGGTASGICPTTLSVEIAIPSVQMMRNNCFFDNDGYDWYLMPAFNQSIAVTTPSACGYNGTGTDSGSFDSYNVDGSVEYSWTGSLVEVWLRASFIFLGSDAGNLTPCSENQTNPPGNLQKCCGITVAFLRSFTNGSGGTITNRFVAGYNHHNIDDCGQSGNTPCPCLTWISGAPIYARSDYTLDHADQGQCTGTGSPFCACAICGDVGDPLYNITVQAVPPLLQVVSASCTSIDITNVNIS